MQLKYSHECKKWETNVYSFICEQNCEQSGVYVQSALINIKTGL